MITKLTIEGFRGIARGTLDGLAPLTVLVGPNNSGKSTVLESLVLVSPDAGGDSLKDLVDRRGLIGQQSVLSFVPSGAGSIEAIDGERRARLELKYKDLRLDGSLQPEGSAFHLGLNDNNGGGWSTGRGEDRQARKRIVEADRAVADPSELERFISWADLAKRRAWLLDVLRPLLPGLKDMRILVPGTRPTVFIEDDSPKPWPAAMAGDGFKRLLAMAARIATDESGLSLVEEPETFLHVGALPQVARLFWEATAAPRNQQIVATTHSLEYLDAQFLDATDEELARAALFRLSLRHGELRAVRVPGEKVRELRADIGEDLRR